MVYVVVAQFSGQAPRPSLLGGGDRGGVAIVHWPQDRDSVELLRAIGRPRLLLVSADAPAPTSSDVDEDWIRLPASEEDLHARSVALASRSSRATARPTVAGDGRLVHRGQWVPLSPIEERLVGALVARFGELVTLGSLAHGADGHDLTPNAIRVHVMRLRKRLRPLGLVVRTIHGRGYLIEAG